MEHLPLRLKNQPIYNLLLPGSHASSAFQLLREPRFNDPEVNKYARLAKHPALREFLENWILSQEMDFYQQLKLGIRKFDLIVDYDKDKGEFYFVRGMANLELTQGLEQFKRYLSRHPGEVLFLSIRYQQLLPLTVSDGIFYLISLMLKPWLIENKTCNRIEPEVTLNTLTKSDKRVFLICSEACRTNEFVWPLEIHDLDGDASNLEEEWKLLDSFIKSIKHARNIGRSFREITLMLIPNDEDVPLIKTLLKPNYEVLSARTMAIDISMHMYEKFDQIDIKLFRKINFISIEFVNRAFVNWIVHYNLDFR